MKHPISYSFPDELFVDSISEKKFAFSKNIPGMGYDYKNSSEYLQSYRDCIFAITHKKNGWDCYRHLEILSQGSCMFMLDIVAIPKYTMTHYPLNHIKQFMQKYGSYSLQFLHKHAYSILYQDLSELLRVSKESLTSTKMFDYIMSTSELQDSKNILYSFTDGDYTLYSLEYGGKQRLGKSFVDQCVNREDGVDFFYRDYPDELALKCYGMGFNYTKIIDPSLKHSFSDEEILEKIKGREFDCIITSKENKYLQHFFNYYEPHEIIVVCKQDCDPLCHPTAGWVTTEKHTCWLNPPPSLHFFQREIGDTL